MRVLELQQLRKNFEGLVAVNELDLSLEQGEIFGLIGPNGAGKTTVFNLISGVLKPSSGRVIFKDRDITNYKPHDVARAGLVRTFQLISLFDGFSVLKNVTTAFHLQSTAGFLRTLFATRYSREEEHRFQAEAMEILSFMGIKDTMNELAGNLPHGHKKGLGVAMALACHPEVLMLDEPLGGMNPQEIAMMMNQLRRIRDERGASILLIEHNMRAVMSICDRIVVMSYGKKIAEGQPLDIKEDPVVIQAYLGLDSHAS